jgi:hypothetical protein
MTGTRDKRSTRRIQPFVVRCRLTSRAGASSAYITDLSLRGARITLQAAPPAAGERVGLDVRFRRTTRHAQLAGDVKWVQPGAQDGSFTLGIRFVGLTDEDLELLEQTVAEFEEQAGRLS